MGIPVLSGKTYTCEMDQLTYLITNINTEAHRSKINQTIQKWIKDPSHPSTHAPRSYNFKTGVPSLILVAFLVEGLSHEGGAAVQQHVVNNIIVLNQGFNLRSRAKSSRKFGNEK